MMNNFWKTFNYYFTKFVINRLQHPSNKNKLSKKNRSCLKTIEIIKKNLCKKGQRIKTNKEIQLICQRIADVKNNAIA